METFALPENAIGPRRSELPVIPGYRLTREIARGGMGIVFEAIHESSGHLFAIKLIHEIGPLTDKARKRFLREVAIASNLNHPNIVRVVDAGEVNGRLYYVMNLVQGRTLEQVVTEEGIDQKRAAEILHEIILAVEYLHCEGVIHRDIKPSNIVLDEHNKPYLTDFGLARLFESHTQLTSSGVVLGTPCYMSPEQARGKPEKVDKITDVFSLGGVLYFTLTGKPPFEGENAAEVVHKVLYDDPIPPSHMTPSINKDLENICLKALCKEPSRRYKSAGEMAEDIQAYLTGKRVKAQPPSIAYRLKRMVVNNAYAFLFGTAMLTLIIFMAVQLFLTKHEKQQERLAYQRAKPLFDRAEFCYSDNRLEEAINFYTAAIAEFPSYAEAYLRRGRLLEEKELVDKALDDYNMAIQLNTSFANAYFSRGCLFMNRKEWERAIRDFSQVILLDPNHAEAYCNRGSVFREIGDFDLALEDYTRSLEIRPGFVPSLENRAYTYMKAGRFNEAIADYHALLAQSDDNVSYLMGMAEAKLRTGEFEEAKTFAREALKLVPDEPTALFLHGAALYEISMRYQPGIETETLLKEAVRELEKSTQKLPDHQEALFYLGSTLLELGRTIQAIEKFERGLSILPPSYKHYIGRAAAMQKLGKFEKALLDCDRAIELAHDLPLPHVMRGSILLDMADFKEAEESFSKAIQIDPECFEAYLNRGIARTKLGEFEGAHRDFTKALEIRNDSRAFLGRGAINAAMNRFDDAIFDFTKAIELNPNDPKAYAARGALLAEMGDAERAAGDLARAKALESERMTRDSKLDGRRKPRRTMQDAEDNAERSDGTNQKQKVEDQEPTSPNQQEERLQSGLRKIAEVIRRTPEEELDIGATALKFIKKAGVQMDLPKLEARLDEWANELKDRIPDARPPDSIIETITKFIYKEKDLMPRAWTSAGQDCRFDLLLEDGEGSCLSFVLLWLSLGERLGMPLHGVLTPRHIFVRWNDGTYRRNIETVIFPESGIEPAHPGQEKPDEEYARVFRIPQHAIDAGTYLSDLSEHEVLGALCNNLAIYFLEEAQSESDFQAFRELVSKAMEWLDTSCMLAPESPVSLVNRGTTSLLYVKDARKALADFDAALQLSREAKTYVFRAIAHFRLADYDSAEQDFREAFRLDFCSSQEELGARLAFLSFLLDARADAQLAIAQSSDILERFPNQPRFLAVLGRALIMSGHVREGLEALSKAVALSPDDPTVRVWRGLGLAHAGLNEDAVREFEIATKLPTDWTDYEIGKAFFFLAKHKLNMHDNIEARRLVEQALRFDPYLIEAMELIKKLE